MDDKSNFYPNEFGWWELPESCVRCKQPLHIASGQDVPFCPNCAIDRKNAYNGRMMLALVKARALKERMNPEHNPGGAFFSGMPL